MVCNSLENIYTYWMKAVLQLLLLPLHVHLCNVASGLGIICIPLLKLMPVPLVRH